MKDDESGFWIRPEMFINEPYVQCPRCGESSFGVLSIHKDSYLRRCAKCGYPRGDERAARFPLPRLKKRLIYSAQMAISNMMKAINPENRKKGAPELDGFWLTLFQKIDALVNMQLVICPSSESHRFESAVSPFFEPLETMYKRLSGGVHFLNFEDIYRFQVTVQFERWMGNQRADLTPRELLRGREVDGWQDRFLISVKIANPSELLEELRQNREQIQQGMDRVFRRWQSETDREFDDWYEEESRDAARVLVQEYQQYLARWAEIQAGVRLPEPGDLLAPMSAVLIGDLRTRLEGLGHTGPDAYRKLLEFLGSEEFRATPYVQISSMLYASYARKAAKGGQKNPPSKGFHNDTKIVASLLPYCDAMFVDNQVRALLTENPLAERLAGYGTKVHSRRTGAAFLAELDDLARTGSPEHLKAVNEVYGAQWSQPFLEVFRHGC